MENKEHIYKNLLLKTIKTCYVKYKKKHGKNVLCRSNKYLMKIIFLKLIIFKKLQNLKFSKMVL